MSKKLRISNFKRTATTFLMLMCCSLFSYATISPGGIMVVGFDGDGISAAAPDHIILAVLENIPIGEVIYLTDNEWNGTTWNGSGEGEYTWTNSTGAPIPAGTIVTINVSTDAFVTAGVGSLVLTGTGNFSLTTSGDDIFIYQGANPTAIPSNFITSFSSGPDGTNTLAGTGLTHGVNAIGDATGDGGTFNNLDVLLYNGSFDCSGGSLTACATMFATSSSFAIQDGVGDESVDGNFPDIPANIPSSSSFNPPPAIAPEINLKGNAVTINDGDASPSTSDDTDFGAIGVTNNDVHTFTIENTGAGALNITAANITGTNAADFAVGGITLPATIAASSSATFTLTFTPGANGVRTATVSLTNNDADEATYDFAVQGTGYACGTVTWTGSTSNDWSVASNWNTGSVPASCHDVIIPNGSTVDIPAGYNSSIKSLVINGTGTLTISATAVLNIDGSTGVGVSLASTCVLTNNGTLNIGKTTAPVQHAIRHNGGTITNNGLLEVGGAGFEGIVSFAVGGTITNSGTMKMGTGSGVRRGIHIRNATTFVNTSTGVLEIENTSNHGIDIGHASAVIQNAGKITAENSSSRAYNFVSNGIYKAVITGASTSYEASSTTDVVNIGTLRLEVDFGSYVPIVGQSFTIISGSSRSGMFNSVSYSSTPCGLTYQLTYNATNVVLTVLTAATSTVTWTGNTSNDWNTASNWDNNSVPAYCNNVVINNGNSVQISSNARTIKSLLIDGSSSLTINASDSLKIDGSDDDGLRVQSGSSLTNNGTINVNNSGNGGGSDNGIDNYGTLNNSGLISINTTSDDAFVQRNIMNNNAGAKIMITNAGDYGMWAGSGGTTTNLGDIQITGTADDGIQIDGATFFNTGDSIIITNAGSYGMLVENSAILTNTGTIIQNNPADDAYRINNNGTLNNNAGGNIVVTSSQDFGLVVDKNGSVNNSGNINITNANDDGIFLWYDVGAGTTASLTNNASGTITVTSAAENGILVDINNTFTNNGTINVSNSTLYGIHTLGTFTSTSGTVNITDAGSYGFFIDVASTTNNSGVINVTDPADDGVRIEGALNNNIGGNIVVKGGVDFGIFIDDKASAIFTNNAAVSISNCSHNTLHIAGTLVNNASGVISISKSLVNHGLYIQTDVGFATPSLTNNGTITIDSVNLNGIQSQGRIDNNSTGTITISYCGDKGIFNNDAANILFDNKGTLSISNTSDDGIESEGAFTNSGTITILNAMDHGFFSDMKSTYEGNNSGTISIANSTRDGLFTRGIFNNLATGQITVNTSGSNVIDDAGLRIDGDNSGLFTNNGTINISNTSYRGIWISASGGGGSLINNNVIITDGVANLGSFTNNNVLRVHGQIDDLTSLGGTIEPGNSPGIANVNGNFNLSSATLKIEVNGITTAGADFDQFNATGTITLGGPLQVVLAHVPTNGDEVTIIESGSSIIGVFSSHNLPTGWTINYDQNSVGHVTLKFATSTLPVELVSFDATVNDIQTVDLSWKTAVEIENEGFEIQHSINGTDWDYIDFVEGYGTTAEAKIYAYEHTSPQSGINYYRLKQIDYNGDYEYSEIESALIESSDKDALEVSVFPNPTIGGCAEIVVVSATNALIEVHIFDNLGGTVSREYVNVEAGENQINIDAGSLADGIYTIGIILGNGQHETLRWVVGK